MPARRHRRVRTAACEYLLSQLLRQRIHPIRIHLCAGVKQRCEGAVRAGEEEIVRRRTSFPRD
jgi:hypothetical protein